MTVCPMREAPKAPALEAPRSARISLPGSVLREVGRVNRRKRLRRKADTLAYRLLHLVFSPFLAPEAEAWRNGYLQGWRDATRSHVEELITTTGRAARGGSP